MFEVDGCHHHRQAHLFSLCFCKGMYLHHTIGRGVNKVSGQGKAIFLLIINAYLNLKTFVKWKVETKFKLNRRLAQVNIMELALTIKKIS